MPPVRMTIACPNCRQPMTAEIQQRFDISKDPNDKQRFLRGGFNLIRCPNCGFQGSAATPLVYHDADKELLLVHVPVEVPLPKPEQEKQVGRLINQAINDLPQEKRKGYLFQPQTMLTLQSMVERVLEGEGFTREMLEAQRAKAALVQEALRTPEEQLPAWAQAHDAELDEAFFQILGASGAAAAAAGDQAAANGVAALSQRLLPFTRLGKEMIAQAQEAEAAARDLEALGSNLTREKFMDLVVAAPNEHRLAAYINLMRPAVDYEFFQDLTRRIERARREDEKARLGQLRDRVLELTREMDEAQKRQVEEATQLLRVLLSSPNPEPLIEANLPALDDTFMAVLEANLRAAEKAGRGDVAQRLRTIGDLVMQALSSAAPPEIQLVNRLLQEETQEAAEAILKERADEINENVLEAMRYVAANLRENNRTEAAERLENLESVAMREAMRARWKANA